MADIAWGGLPVLVPSTLCSKYLRADVVAEEDIEIGARHRAKKDLLENVRGLKALRSEMRECLDEMRRERLYYHLMTKPTSLSTVVAMEMQENKPILRRKPLFKNTVPTLNRWEPRLESVLGMRDVTRLLVNPYKDVRLPRKRSND